MSGRSVLITGGFGNLGSWLTTHFIRSGYDVTVLSQRKKDFISGRYKWIGCDITDERQCRQGLGGKAFDFVVHTASVNDTFVEGYAEKALLVNTLGTRNLLEALQRSSLKNFVYLSTFHVYGATDGFIDEETPVNPRHDYASTHLFAEYYVRQFNRTVGLPYTILRLTNGYGCPMDSDSSKWYLVLNDLARMAFEKKEIILSSNGKAQRDFIWLGTVCRTIDSILKLPTPPNDIFNLASGVTFRLTDIAEAVQMAYSEVYGKTLLIRVNENDKTEHHETLQVGITRLTSLVDYTPENRFREEAKDIFRLLEQQR